jgi:hypothetical protein
MNINDRLAQEFGRLLNVEKNYLDDQRLPARTAKAFQVDQNNEDFMNEFRRLQDIEQHFLNLQRHVLSRF